MIVFATIVNCRFSDNSASQSGGALVAANGSYTQIQASQFESNRAEVRGTCCVVVCVLS